MFNVKTEDNAIKIIDPRTGGVKCRIHVQEPIVNAPQINGNDVMLQVRDGDNIRTKIYDSRTGGVKGNYA